MVSVKMIEYHIFPTPPDAEKWLHPFVVHAESDEAIKKAFPNADRIYSAKWGGLIRVA